jgi:predicted O-linked N-acetylglucosamine transferase (SPINDLY family)
MDPAQLHWLRAKLAEARTTAPLFDIARFTRDIEAAYATIKSRRRAGLPPDHIRVAG